MTCIRSLGVGESRRIPNRQGTVPNDVFDRLMVAILTTNRS